MTGHAKAQPGMTDSADSGILSSTHYESDLNLQFGIETFEERPKEQGIKNSLYPPLREPPVVL